LSKFYWTAIVEEIVRSGCLEVDCLWDEVAS